MGYETTTTEEGLDSPLLRCYSFDERQAILVHKYYLGIEAGYDPGLSHAIASWESRFATDWRRRRHLDDCRQQMREIAAHRSGLIRQSGRDVSWEHAARDWIVRHASTWRDHHRR